MLIGVYCGLSEGWLQRLNRDIGYVIIKLKQGVKIMHGRYTVHSLVKGKYVVLILLLPVVI